MINPKTNEMFINGQAKIRAEHRNRTAYIYMRQSTAAQVIYHRESQINQERMADRARLLGWDAAHVQIIRSDLGQSGREADNRQGFQMLLTEISLGRVGIIFGYEVSRLSRNNSDWYRLLEAAAIFDTLIADYDGIYDLNLFNDRLLLGLKGTMSEAELHLIQLRLVGGRNRQLERGVYRQFLPTGYIRLADGSVIQDPNQQVRHVFQLIFEKFREVSSCGQLLSYFCEENILIPRRQVSGIHKGEILWKLPTYSALYETLTTPTYAGTFVYGRRQTQRGTTTRLRKALDEWKYIHHDVYPGYITWDEYLENQDRLRNNRPATNPANELGAGAIREGSALLQGLVYCGICGQRMATAHTYQGRYCCQMLRRQFGEPNCQWVNAACIDPVVVQAFFEALQPAQFDALVSVVERHDQQYQQVKQYWQNRLQQATYAMQRAQRQYQAVEPENRLVAAELERRWEATLRDLQATQAAYETFEQDQQPLHLSPEMRQQFQQICQTLPALWDKLANSHKKALLRSLIAKVIVHRHKSDEVEIKIIWVSGHVSLHTTHVFVHQNQNLSNYDRMLGRIQELWQQNLHDKVIAQILTAEGFTTARLHHVSPYTVQNIRMEKRWLRSSSPRIETPTGYLKVAELAQQLQVQASWLYQCIRDGRIAPDDFVRFPKRNVILIRDEPNVLEKIRQLKQTFS